MSFVEIYNNICVPFKLKNKNKTKTIQKWKSASACIDLRQKECTTVVMLGASLLLVQLRFRSVIVHLECRKKKSGSYIL